MPSVSFKLTFWMELSDISEKQIACNDFFGFKGEVWKIDYWEILMATIKVIQPITSLR